ncbi:hypothetical protein BCR36DRAFT_586430 [Piromyces finnis]|uniref:Uncharacterized protein n=1 Tax=Piromyces finnis TaxID=1754191 RepID=A0A1Y1UZB7_9FUNG|nr:hypothetical protein BCR36DRAFT_586430 [Piromyces finnis]|eukprot:ORX43966.1 hypothetical protein BCR36DRAFT_586430 [Piromyces finnis]
MKSFITLLFLAILSCIYKSEKAFVGATSYPFPPFFQTTYPYSIISGFSITDTRYKPIYTHVRSCRFDTEDLSVTCKIDNSDEKLIITGIEIDNPDNCSLGPLSWANLVCEGDSHTYIMNERSDYFDRFKFYDLNDCSYHVKIGERNIGSYDELYFPYDSQVMDTDFYLEDDANIADVDYIHVNSCEYDISGKVILCTVNNVAGKNITVKFTSIYLQQNINKCYVNDNSIVSVHFYDKEEKEDLTIVGKTSGSSDSKKVFFELSDGCNIGALYSSIIVEDNSIDY